MTWATKTWTSAVLTSADMNTYVSGNDQYLYDNLFVKVVKGTLTAGVQHAEIFSWRNTAESSAILIWLILIDITTPSAAAAKINVGQAADDDESDNLIDGAALDSTGVRNSIINPGANGKGAQHVADDEWITGYEDDSAASTNLVGKYYIFYTKI